MIAKQAISMQCFCMRWAIMIAALSLAGCEPSAAEKARKDAAFQKAVRVEARRLIDEELGEKYLSPPTDRDARQNGEPALRREEDNASTGVDEAFCWDDYCPCDTEDPDYGGADIVVCRNLKMGVQMDAGLIAGAAGMRDARRASREWERDNPDF